MTAIDTPAVARAIETTDRVSSHLHPVASFDLADHQAPTGREEVWRFTPMRRMRALLEAEPTGEQLTWDTTLPSGVTLTDISLDKARELGAAAPYDRVSALAVAHSPTTHHIDVPADAQLDEPVEIRLSGTGLDKTVHGHTIVTVGQHAKVTLMFTHEGSTTYAASRTIVVGDGADVTVVSVQDWDDDAVHAGQTSLQVGRDARVRSVVVTFGGDLVRLTENVEYAGTGGEAELLGIYFADAGQHLEHRLFVDHNQPRTRSNVDYKGALQGKDAHTVWVGDVLIRKVAEGIDTYESNRNLVLTEGCRADSIPNLEIETGEIEGAGHASTTGRFDDEQLFYLTSRGIPEVEARRLVVRGFFADIIHKIGIPALEQTLIEAVEEELARSESAGSAALVSPDQSTTQSS